MKQMIAAPLLLHDEPVKLTSLYHQRRMSRCPGVRSERAFAELFDLAPFR
jgi:hypothetical protein